MNTEMVVFQPTLPARGATAIGRASHRACGYFNPRSPHGERLFDDDRSVVVGIFQPTLPARGATRASLRGTISTGGFQPTLPARGATATARRGTPHSFHFNPRSPHGERPKSSRAQSGRMEISTHAPHTGSDAARNLRASPGPDFNPRSPHGERPRPLTTVMKSQRFQPTLPARGATDFTLPIFSARHFNPRSPHGERRHVAMGIQQILISTHAPRTGSDTSTRKLAEPFRHFNPRSPHGERPFQPSRKWREKIFQPTLPARGATSGLPRTSNQNS